MLRLTPLRTKMRMRARTLSGDQRIQRTPHIARRDRHVPARAVVAEEDEAELAADVLLVALQRRPGALAVDLDRLRAQDLVDDGGVAAGELERRLEAEGDRLAVRDVLVLRRGLERVREGVTEGELLPLAVVVRVAQADRPLERSARAYVERLPQLPAR